MIFFTPSFKYRKTYLPVITSVALFVLLNIIVYLLPEDYYSMVYKESIAIGKKIGKSQDVLLLGDSRATMFYREFFRKETLSLACPNMPITYSKWLFDKLISETDIRPKVIIITVGSNNYNKNGIFPLRDYAIRRLASLSDIFSFAAYPNGYEYMIDAFFSKVVPIYGRRIEIRTSPIVELLWGPPGGPLVGQMYPIDLSKFKTPDRSPIEDKNYLLIYKRSVYNNYLLSRFHTKLLEELIDKGIENHAKVVIVQLPVEPMMREIEKKLVGNIFDNYLINLRELKSFVYLDLRDNNKFEFADLNHLSARGARSLVNELLDPEIEKLMAN